MLTQSFIEKSEELEQFSILPSSSSLTNKNFPESDFLLKNHVLVPYLEESNFNSIHGLSDDNRSVIIPNSSYTINEHELLLSIKGVGAKTPLYGTDPFDFEPVKDFKIGLNKIFTNSKKRLITHENWFGESPYGAHGYGNAISDLELSEIYFEGGFHGANICPVIEINEIPNDYILKNSNTYWFKKYDNSFYQEKRLVPSNIRLFHQSDLTLGQSPDLVLSKFSINDHIELENFIQNYIISGLALLTLLPRTIIKDTSNDCFKGLDYIDVWLDKDSVLAPDGTLFFIDLEGLDWIPITNSESLKMNVLKQVNRNYYEFMYSLDLLLKERDKKLGKKSDQFNKREFVANLIEMAVIGDQYLKSELSSTALDLIIDPKNNYEKISFRFIDLV